MATLTAFNTLSRTTIADGDSLNGNIDTAKKNDDAMLSETISTYNTAKSVHDTVSTFSAKEWLNSNNKNFSEIIVNDTYTAKGASKLGSNFTFSAGKHMSLNKTNDTYSFAPDESVASVSSYFKYARFNSDMGLYNNDPFILQCSFIHIAGASFAMHDQYVDNIDGFCKTDYNYRNNQLFTTGNLNQLGYSATTRILTSANLPTDEASKDLKILSHTVPKGGSFLCDHYDNNVTENMPYRGEALLDRCSMSMSHNNFATNYSIAIDVKGSSASNYSIIFGNATTQMWGPSTSAKYVMTGSMVATNSSTCLGPGSVVGNKTVCIMPFADKAQICISAANRSIGISPVVVEKGSDTNKQYAISDNSLMVLCNGYIPITAKDSIMLFQDKKYQDAGLLYTSYSANRSLCMFTQDGPWQSRRQTADNSVELITQIQNAKDSVVIGVKGTGINYSQYSVNNSFVANGHFNLTADVNVNNSCFIGFTEGNTYTTAYNSCYTIASPVLGSVMPNKTYTQVFSIGPVAYDFQDKNTYLLMYAGSPVLSRVDGYNNLIACTVATAISGDGNVWIKGTNFYKGASRCNRNLILGHNFNISGDDTVIDSNEIYEQYTNLNNIVASTITAASSCFIHAYSVVQGAQYYTTITTVDHTVAMQQSSAYSNNSLSMADSIVRETWTYYDGNTAHDTSKNYLLAVFNSTASKETERDGTLDDDTQLVMWKNTLKKHDLPKSQLQHITEVTDITTLNDDIYYIIG